MASTHNKESLTDQLLELDREGLKAATQVPFLSLAGKGLLPKAILEKWLAQDRLYAQAYQRFAALLLANVHLSSSLDGEVADLLVDALVNIRRELKFFESVAEEYGLDIDAKEEVSEGVKGYRELFGIGEEIERGEKGVLEGMVLLWGTEICYLKAWSYAASFLKEAGRGGGEDADGGALRKEFIPNWTSDEFVAFVEKIAALVDRLWEERERQEKTEEEREKERKRVEELWRRILSVEREFWPEV